MELENYLMFEKANSKLAFAVKSLKLLLDEGAKLAGEELQGLYEILCEVQKAIDLELDNKKLLNSFYFYKERVDALEKLYREEKDKMPESFNIKIANILANGQAKINN